MIEQKLQSNVQPRDVSIDVDRPSHHRVAGQHAGGAIRRTDLVRHPVARRRDAGSAGTIRRRGTRSRRRSASGRSSSKARITSRKVTSPSPRTMTSTPIAGSVHASGARLGSYPPTTMRTLGLQRSNERDDAARRRSLERHHREADDVRLECRRRAARRFGVRTTAPGPRSATATR